MDAQFDFAIVAGIGALVGLGELVPRYRDAPASAIRTPAAVLYIGVNALASAIALLLTRQLGWEGTSDTNQQTRVLQILVAGFGAMALLRSSLTSVKAGGEIVTAGPGNLLRTVLVAVDEAVDRNRARARSKAIRQIMKGIAFDKSYLPLPLTCFALMQNPREEDKVRLGEATKALMRARTPEDALAVVLRLLVAQRLADTDGLPNADRQGVYEPQELAASKTLDKLARRVAPPSVKRRLAEQAAERERREQAWRDEQAARLTEQREKLAAGETVRCECCLGMIESPSEAVEKHGHLVHSGDCEQRWGSGSDSDDEDEAS